MKFFSLIFYCLYFFALLTPTATHAENQDRKQGLEPITILNYIPESLDEKSAFRLNKNQKGLGKVLSWVSQRFKKNIQRIEILKIVLTKDAKNSTKLHAGALVALIIGLASLFLLRFILGPVAVLLGLLSMTQIDKNQNTYNGRIFAVVGLVLGLIGIIVALLLS